VVDIGSKWIEFGPPQGGTYDILIKDVKDFNPSGEEIYVPYDHRVGPFLTTAAVIAPASPKTDVRNVFLCENCNTKIETGKLCEPCREILHPAVNGCEHLKLGAASPTHCGNAIVKGYGACLEHLEQMGIKVRKARKPRAKKVVEAVAATPIVEAPLKPKRQKRVTLTQPSFPGM
jgi:hypothetical protein